MIQIEQWPAPWYGITPDRGREVEKELIAEIGREHQLYSQRITVLGARADRDDFLVALPGDRVAIVHATYARHPEPAPWPHTTLFNSVDEWMADALSEADLWD
jgi:hypothetical protein